MMAAAPSRMAAGLIGLGASTGYRVSELLLIKVGMAFHGGEPASTLCLARRAMKFGRSASRNRTVYGRTVPLNADAKAAIRLLVGSDPNPHRYLFQSRKGTNRPIRVHHAIRLIHETARRAAIDPHRVTTHALRKTFAARLYAMTGHDLDAVRHALGHRSVETTRRYLDLDEARVCAAILAMSIREDGPATTINSPALPFSPAALPA